MPSIDQSTIFLHVPKTAGSTFHLILGARFDGRETRNLFGARYSDPEVVDFIALPEAMRRKIRLLKGHMPYGLHEYLPQPSKYITVLRDPVERVVSQYFYIKKNKHNPLHDKLMSSGLGIGDFIKSGMSVGLNNGQTRFLSGDFDQMPFGSNDEALLARVLESLESKFLWIGLTERFDESLLILARLLGWKRKPFYIRENVSKIRKRSDELDSDDIAVIKEYNRLDIALYEYANRRLQAEIDKIPDFSEQLAQYRDENLRFQKRYGWIPDRFKRYVY